MDEFEHFIITKMQLNPKYQCLLEADPSQLAKVMKQDGFTPIVLKWPNAMRAKAQTKVLQRLPFPNHYAAFARLFYRCFRDTKGRMIWNDTRNRTEFRKYLKQQFSRINDDIIVDIIPEKARRAKEEHMDSVEETVYDGTEEADTEYSMKTAFNNVIGQEEQGRTLYKGTRGGYFYVNGSGNRTYLNADQKAKVQNHRTAALDDLKTENRSPGKTSPSTDHESGVDEKGRILYRSKRGKIYRFTKSGNRVYVSK